jgi:cell division protease FtsH
MNVNQEEHSVLLLDEIQRFKTIDEEGHDITDVGMQDIWMLLSDGTLGSRNSLKSDLMTFLVEMHSDIYHLEKREQEKKKPKDDIDDIDEDDEDDDNMYSWSRRYNANKLYRFDNSVKVEKYAQMTPYEQRDKVVELLSDVNTFVPKPYRKMLIFISGNLDEAFHVATDTDEVEIDADIIYEETKKVNVLDIKNALRRRFKPEQIARFGNNYVIYPSLNKKAYQKIIKTRIGSFIKDANKLLKKYNLKLNVKKSVNKLLYKNGVYPAQGVRPILSTIDSFINNVIPKVVIRCEGSVKGTIDISSEEKDHITINVKNHKINKKIKFVGEIDKIKEQEKEKINKIANTAVHEAGHTVLHCLLYGNSPKVVKIAAASTTKEGFIYNSVIPRTLKELEEYAVILFGGILAEKMVFGEKNISSGATCDITYATEQLMGMIRHFGMVEDSMFNVAANNDSRVNNTDPSDQWVKEKSQELVKRTKSLLEENEHFFKAIVKALWVKKELKPEEIQEIAKKRGINLEVKESGDNHYGFHKELNEYLK